jgi:hypothetical protein
MATASKVWAGLSLDKRRELLKMLWNSEQIIEFELKLKWNKLLPSTQKQLIVALAAYDANPELCEKTPGDRKGE